MDKEDKRGLSSVVTTLIIILLSLVSIGIIWVVVSNIISGGSDEVSIEQFSIDVNFLSASINGNNITMTVKRASGIGNMSGMRFVVTDNSNSEDFTVKQSLVELQEKTFSVTILSLTPTNVKSVIVAPIYISSSGKETVGGVTDTYKFGGGGTGGGIGGNGGNGGNGENGGNGGNGENGSNEECVPACTGEDTCVNGICVPPGCTETRTDEEVCTDAGAICDDVHDNCGNLINCDIAIGGCSPIEQCVDNLCVPLTAISGTIDSVWPLGIAIWFDSSDLPVDNVYSGFYAKFLAPSQESECLLVSDYQLPQPPQTTVRVELEAVQTSIAPGDNVELWPSFNSCMG